MGAQITAWSFSRLELYGYDGAPGCAFAFKCKHIDKIPEEQSPAMARGDQVHKAGAKWLMQSTGHPSLPKDFEKFSDLMHELRRIPKEDFVVEQQWAFTHQWKPIDWFNKATYVRVIVDAGVVYPDGTAEAIDHKTGRMYDKNADQRELNGIAMLRRFPHLSHVTSRMWYLDSGIETTCEIEQSDVPELIVKWDARAKPMLEDKVFAPTPGERCRRCSFARSKNGPCRFG